MRVIHYAIQAHISFFLKRKKKKEKTYTPQIGIEPTTFRLTAERANQLRH